MDDVFYAKRTAPVEGAQWSGIVTSIAVEMLRSGKVEAVVCVQSEPDNKMAPNPVLATTVRRCKLDPNLKAPGFKSLT